MRSLRVALGRALAAVALTLAACSPSSPGAEGTGGTPAKGAGSLAADSALVVRLDLEARALAQAGPCSSPLQCGAAPLGHRACGGPREYLVYCRTTTDSVALFAKLAELQRAEEAWNTKRGAMSTCEMRMAPPLDLAGQRCVAAGLR